jgi:site-specific DNA-methyltransferase (adenine-specific)
VTPFVNDADFTLYVGDALEVLRLLPGESVDAVVTSPPYADARLDYDHVSAHEYGDWTHAWVSAALPVVKTSGSLLLNLGRLHRNGEESDYWIDALNRARAAGWKWIDTIVWRKTKAVPKAGPYLHDVHEYVLWFARRTDAYRGYDEETRVPHSPLTVARYARGKLSGQKGQAHRERPPLNPLGGRPTSVYTSSVGIAPGNPHPAPMADDLARHLIALSCPHGGTVLDPFMGSGTTALVARKLGRRSIGIELSPEYATLCAERLQQQSLFAGEAA